MNLLPPDWYVPLIKYVLILFIPLLGIVLLKEALYRLFKSIFSEIEHTRGLARLDKTYGDSHGGFSISKVDRMNGIDFELFVEKLFNVLDGNVLEKIETTPVTGDHGCDLILRYKNGKVRGIQCKCYSDNVGNKAVQEIVTSKAVYRLTDLTVVANSYFTPGAKYEAKLNNVLLVDRDKLQALIKEYNKILQEQPEQKRVTK